MSTQIRHFLNLKKRDIHFADKRKKNSEESAFFLLKKNPGIETRTFSAKDDEEGPPAPTSPQL